MDSSKSSGEGTSLAALSARDLKAIMRAIEALNEYAGHNWEARLPKPLRKRKTYVVRVDLAEMKPPVWRRLVVASDLTMEQFGVVIEASFGWTGYHLHSFDLWVEARASYFHRLLTRYDIEQEGEEGLAEADVQLCQVLVKPGDKVLYTYDFGDNWRHRVRLETVSDWTPDAPLAQCVGGRRACPPEDCGGPWGYGMLLSRMGEQHGDDAESDDFWGELPVDFDPASFDLDEINHRLDSEARGGFVHPSIW